MKKILIIAFLGLIASAVAANDSFVADDLYTCGVFGVEKVVSATCEQAQECALNAGRREKTTVPSRKPLLVRKTQEPVAAVKVEYNKGEVVVKIPTGGNRAELPKVSILPDSEKTFFIKIEQ